MIGQQQTVSWKMHLQNVSLRGSHVWHSYQGWVAYQFSYTMRHNDTRGAGGRGMGGSYHWFLKFKKWPNFKVHELPWTFNELRICFIVGEKDYVIFTKLVKKLRNESAIKALVSSSKKNTRKKNKKTQTTRQRKLWISNYNIQF